MPDTTQETDEGEPSEPGELTPIQREILAELVDGKNHGIPWGRSTPSNIADTLDVSKQYIHQELRVLQSAGLVQKFARGVYELTERGIDVAERARSADAVDLDLPGE